MIKPNEKITLDTVAEIFANIGLTEAITHHHRTIGLVQMYQRGSHTICGIYTLITIQVSAGGYLLFRIIS